MITSPAAWQTLQRRYLGWIWGAKKLETQQRRAGEAVQMLEQGLELNGK